MPRAESQAKHLGAQFYHSQFTGAQYLPDSNSSTSSPPLSPASQHPSTPSASASSGSGGKKKHVCGTCDRAFTTSGHLARHSRVHTGERNHKCPFPGCETRCSRQDNLQQHYRIHLSPGSRRSSTRTAGGRVSKKAAAAAAAAAAASAAASEAPESPPSLASPPPLEPAHIYSHHSSPPDSPPPLAQATLPATATLALTNSRMESSSDRSSSSSSPETSYTTPHHLLPMSSQGLGMSGSNSQSYSYRSGTSTYQEQSQGNGFQYIHAGSGSGNSISNGNSYSSNHDSYSMHQPPQNRGNSPVSISSRHSISHISHPQSSYSQAQSTAAPASPSSSQSVSSHTSGPPTPTYPVFHDDGTHAYHQSNGMMAEHANMGASHINSQSHMMHNAYSSSGTVHNQSRFDSPPPILAPIQDVRFIRHRDDRHSQSHASSYMHQPQPLGSEAYSYHQSLGLGHGAWKGESGMRKNAGAALV